MPPSENIMMRKLCRFKISRLKIKSFARNQERIRTANHTLLEHLQLLYAQDWCLIQTQTSLYLSPKWWNRLKKQWGGSSCFVQEANNKGVAYPGSCEEGKQHCSLLQHNFRAFPPTLGPPAPVKGDSASPVAWGLMELRSLNMHSHTERNRFELQGLCRSLALNMKCTVMPSLFQLKAKCLSSLLKTHGCQNICWSDKLQKQRPHSDCREESHCCKPAPGKRSIPTYKTEHHPKVKRK